MLKRKSIIAFLLALNISILNCNEIVADYDKVTQVTDFDVANKNLLINNCLNTFIKDIPYQYEDAYIPKESINDMLHILKDHKDFEEINTLTSDQIVGRIIDNSLNESDETYNSVFETEDSLAYEQTLKSIIEDLFNNAKNDINEDLYLIKNLKIMYVDENFREQYIDMETNGMYYNKELNTIIIHRDSLFVKDEEPYSPEYYNVLKRNLIHIINDVRQIPVNNQSYLNYSPLYNTTLKEDASTRYIKYYDRFDVNYDDVDTPAYENDMNSLILLSIFNKEATPEKYFQILYDGDAKEFYKLLNLKNEEAVYKFYKALYAIDAKNYNNNFFEYYAQKGRKKETMTEAIGYNYKVTLYNLYVSNLLDYMKNHHIEYKECIYLYYLGFNTIMDKYNPKTDEDDNLMSFNDVYLLDIINQEHDKFMDFVCKYYNIDIKEINAYASRITYDNKIINGKYPMLKLISTKNINKNNYKTLFEERNISSSRFI